MTISASGSNRHARRSAAIVAILALLGAGLAAFFGAAPPAYAAPGPGEGVPVAEAGNVTIKVGGDRNPSGAIDPLAGVSFDVYQANSSGNATGGVVASCTTDATGMCNVDLAPRWVFNLFNGPFGYVVVPTDVPDGYDLLPQVTTSSGTVPYVYQTGAIYEGQAYTIPINVNASTSRNQTTSGTAMPAARSNPTLAPQCGLNIALVLDLSGSVTPGDLQNLKVAAQAYVNALVGTPSRVAVYTFGTRSPAASTSGNNNANLGLTSVATAASAQTVLNKINGLTVPPNSGTNWDAAFRAVTSLADQGLNSAVMITDGMPTFYNINGDGLGDTTRYIELEHAIASANALKAAGTTVQAVGIGAALTTAPANLIAISGPTANTDYFQVTNYAQLAATLNALASENCAGTVNVAKSVIPAGGGAAQPAAGWEMNASTAPDSAVRVSGSTDPFAETATSPTGGTGVASFEVDVDSGETQLIEIRETQQSGHSLVLQDGFNARCVDTANPDVPLPVTNLDDPSQPGFSVSAIGGATIACEIINQASEQTAQLQVQKEWWFDLEGDGTFDGPYAPDDELPVPNLSAALQLSGDGSGLPPAPHFFGDLYANLVPGASVEIGESVTGLPPLCSNEAEGLGAVVLQPTGGVDPPFVNTATIVNRVTCTSQLTLEKRLVSFSETTTAEDWEMSATAIDGASPLPGPQDAVTGTDDATAPITPDVRYALSEAGLTDEARDDYDQRWNPSIVAQWESALGAGATGSWICVLATSVDANGDPVWGTDEFDGRNGGVTVSVGQWAKCRAENETKPELELLKRVFVDGAERTPSPELAAQWTLGATWSSPVPPDAEGNTFTPPAVQDPLSGAGGVERVAVLPGAYVPTETGTVDGYTNGTEWTCTLDSQPDDPFVIGSGQIDLVSGDGASCAIVNTAAQPTLQLVKAVEGGPAPATDWVLTATPTTVVDPVAPTVTNPDGGDTEPTEVYTNTGYLLSEAGRDDIDVSGYEAGDWSCVDSGGETVEVTPGDPGTATIAPLDVGQQLVCTITNTAIAPTVELHKLIEGGGSTPSDWVLNGTGADSEINPDGTPGDIAATDVAVGDELALSEGPAEGFDDGAFQRGEWVCTIVSGPTTPALEVTQDGPGQATLAGLAPGQNVSCTVTNQREAALQLTKTVEAGADERWSDQDWVLSGTGESSDVNPDGEPGSLPLRVVAIGDELALGEAPNPPFAGEGFTTGEWSCELIAGPSEPPLVVTQTGAGTATLGGLAAGQEVECTIVNTAIAPTLALDKTVSGGDATADDWILSGTGNQGTDVNPDGAPGPVPATEIGLGETFAFGEAPDGWDDADYARDGWNCEVVAGPAEPAPMLTNTGDGDASLQPLAPGQQVACTAANRFMDPAAIALDKRVDGGTATADDWVLTGDVDGEWVINPDGTPGPVAVTDILPGQEIVLVETPRAGFDATGYTAVGWTCELAPDSPGEPPTVTDLGDGRAQLSPLGERQVVTCTAHNVFAAPPVPPVPPNPPGPIPATGFDGGGLALLALVLLGLGGVVALRRRRVA